MEINFFQEEIDLTRDLFDLEEVLEFQMDHKVDVMLCSDLQYACYIDYKKGNRAHGTGLTFMGALVEGIRRYKIHNITNINEDGN